MKTKQLFICLLLFIGGIADTAQAQFIKESLKGKNPGCEKQLSFDKSKYDKRQSENGEWVYYKKQFACKPRADVQTYSITPDPRFDGETYSYTMAVVYSRDEKKIVASLIDDEDGSNAVVQLPAGIYDLFVSFESVSEVPVSYFVVKEGIRVDKDASWTYSPSEAKNHVTTEIYTETGEVVTADSKNLGQPDVNCNVYLNGYCVAGFSTWSFVDFYISDVKEAVRIAEMIAVNLREGRTKKEYYINKLQHTGEINDHLVLKNQPSDYTLHTEYFRRGPRADRAVQVERSGIVIESYLADDPLGEAYMTSTSRLNVTTDSISDEPDYFEKYPVRIYLNNPFQVLSENNPCNILASTSIVESIDTLGYIINESDGSVKYKSFARRFISPRLALNSDGKALYMNYASGDFSVSPTGTELYTFQADEDHPVMLGDNCPVMLFPYEEDRDDSDTRYAYFDPVFIGSYGELRENKFDAEVKFNDRVVFEGDTLSSFWKEWEKSERHKGKFEINTTNENVYVGETPGKNITKVIYDNTLTDAEFPRIQRVQFRNGQGKVTHRFDRPEEMKLLFSAGDFDYDNFIFKYKKVKELSVNYALHGNSDWKELAYKQVESGSRAFGDTYETSLAGQIIENSNQWYDLKITGSDASGNLQTQILSPAFFVAAPSSIDSTTADENAMPYYIKNRILHVPSGFDAVEIYTLAGGLVDAVQGLRYSLPMTGLKNGVYLVKLMSRGDNHTLKVILSN